MYGLDDSLVIRLKSLFTGYQKIDKVILFGSLAKGTFRNGADIDLAIVAKSEINFGSLDDDQLTSPYQGLGILLTDCIIRTIQAMNAGGGAGFLDHTTDSSA